MQVKEEGQKGLLEKLFTRNKSNKDSSCGAFQFFDYPNDSLYDDCLLFPYCMSTEDRKQYSVDYTLGVLPGRFRSDCKYRNQWIPRSTFKLLFLVNWNTYEDQKCSYYTMRDYGFVLGYEMYEIRTFEECERRCKTGIWFWRIVFVTFTINKNSNSLKKIHTVEHSSSKIG